MKRFFNWLRDNAVFFVLLAIPCAILVVSLVGILCSIFSSFKPMVKFLTKIGSGYWFIGLIITPFAIISLIQIFRGAILLLEVDADVFGLNEKRKDWKGSLYIVINLLSYMALYILLKRI